MVNVGRGIDEVQDRQRRRKLTTLKESCQQALSFTRSYNAELTSIFLRTKTTNDKIIIDYEEPGLPPPIASSSCSDDVQRVLYLLDRYGVSDHFYHELSMTVPSLLRSYKVKQTRGALSSEVELNKPPAPYHGCYRSLTDTITNVLSKEVL